MWPLLSFRCAYSYGGHEKWSFLSFRKYKSKEKCPFAAAFLRGEERKNWRFWQIFFWSGFLDRKNEKKEVMMKRQWFFLSVFFILMNLSVFASEQTPAEASIPSDPHLAYGSLPVRHLWGDFDNDGLKDLFALSLKGNRLFHNLGNGEFEDVTALAFVDAVQKGIAGAWSDYDQDGLLDLFLFHSEGLTLWRNEKGCLFVDVTKASGLDPALLGKELHIEDYDKDGLPDLFVLTASGDSIFHNQGSGEFKEVALPGLGPNPGAPPLEKGSEMLAPSTKDLFNPGKGDKKTMGGTFTGSKDPVSKQKKDPDLVYLNDNSPDSVGAGVPEVEGGNDGSTSNDIVDGTVTGADIADQSITGDDVLIHSLLGEHIADGSVSGAKIQDGSLTGADIQPGSIAGDHVGEGTLIGEHIGDGSLTGVDIHDYSLTGVDILDESLEAWKISGVAATLSGSQNFDNGTLFIDALNDRVGIGTASPTTRLHVAASSGNGIYASGEDGVYGYTSAASGRGIYGYAGHLTGITYGVFGQSDSMSGLGVAGHATASYGNAYGVYGVSESDTGRGVFGYAFATTGDNYGVYGQSRSSAGRGVFGYASATSGWARGVQGKTDSTTGSGVHGYATASSGESHGVFGVSDSTSGRGVQGLATASTGTTYGIYGQSNSANGIGVCGRGEGTNGVGVYARSVYGKAVDALTTSNSTNEWVPAIYGRNEGAGDGIYGWSQNRDGAVGITYGSSGRGVYGANMDSGNYGYLGGSNYGVYGYSDSGYAGYFDGTLRTEVLQIEGGSDLSEQFEIHGASEEMSPVSGMVVCIDPERPGDLVISTRAYDQCVAGIISGAGGVKPGMLMGQKGSKACGNTPVALTGRVYCLVDAAYGAIQPGDLLTTSPVPGHAMKAVDAAKAHGAILGKAMTSLASGRGLVLVLVTLH